VHILPFTGAKNPAVAGTVATIRAPVSASMIDEATGSARAFARFRWPMTRSAAYPR